MKRLYTSNSILVVVVFITLVMVVLEVCVNKYLFKGKDSRNQRSKENNKTTGVE